MYNIAEIYNFKRGNYYQDYFPTLVQHSSQFVQGLLAWRQIEAVSLTPRAV